MALTKISTPGIKDEAITLAKLLHGDSNSNGKFLRANNGADPTFETINTDLVADTTPQLGGTLDANGHDIKLGDNIPIRLGNATFGDLKILHSGSTGVLDNVTGDLHIKTTGSGDDIVLISNDDIELQVAGGEAGIKVIGDGAVELYHNQIKKLETHDKGIIITQTNSNQANGALKINTTLDNYGSVIVRDQSHSNASIGAFQVENNSSGTNETNFVMRSVNLNSTAWAHAFYGAKSHRFGIQANVDNAIKCQIDLDGLKFNGDQASANALNDYEEGDWTPALSQGSPSYTTQKGLYTKIGELVLCSFYLNYTNGAHSSQRIMGLPFAPDTSRETINAVSRLGSAFNEGLSSGSRVMHSISFTSQGNTRIYVDLIINVASRGVRGTFMYRAA